jgi:hypothetical protein
MTVTQPSARHLDDDAGERHSGDPTPARQRTTTYQQLTAQTGSQWLI